MDRCGLASGLQCREIAMEGYVLGRRPQHWHVGVRRVQPGIQRGIGQTRPFGDRIEEARSRRSAGAYALIFRKISHRRAGRRHL